MAMRLANSEVNDYGSVQPAVELRSFKHQLLIQVCQGTMLNMTRLRYGTNDAFHCYPFGCEYLSSQIHVGACTVVDLADCSI